MIFVYVLLNKFYFSISVKLTDTYFIRYDWYNFINSYIEITLYVHLIIKSLWNKKNQNFLKYKIFKNERIKCSLNSTKKLKKILFQMYFISLSQPKNWLDNYVYTRF